METEYYERLDKTQFPWKKLQQATMQYDDSGAKWYNLTPQVPTLLAYEDSEFTGPWIESLRKVMTTYGLDKPMQLHLETEHKPLFDAGKKAAGEKSRLLIDYSMLCRPVPLTVLQVTKTKKSDGTAESELWWYLIENEFHSFGKSRVVVKTVKEMVDHGLFNTKLALQDSHGESFFTTLRPVLWTNKLSYIKPSGIRELEVATVSKFIPKACLMAVPLPLPSISVPFWKVAKVLNAPLASVRGVTTIARVPWTQKNRMVIAASLTYTKYYWAFWDETHPLEVRLLLISDGAQQQQPLQTRPAGSFWRYYKVAFYLDWTKYVSTPELKNIVGKNLSQVMTPDGVFNRIINLSQLHWSWAKKDPEEDVVLNTQTFRKYFNKKPTT